MQYKWTVDYFASCYECPHQDNWERCGKTGKKFEDTMEIIPSWCPLPDYNESDWVD